MENSDSAIVKMHKNRCHALPVDPRGPELKIESNKSGVTDFRALTETENSNSAIVKMHKIGATPSPLVLEPWVKDQI